ncbi:MAG TPA: DUF721 domain-containing protein, partial [Luteibaculaceae bacterium]|nr:DUF721 domain-containing protein [Luteibaculaceae bacterium]
MRRKDNTESLKQVIDRLLNVYQLEDKFTEVAFIKSWSDLLGPAIAKRTTRLFIKDRKLFVTLNSAPLKQELSLG